MNIDRFEKIDKHKAMIPHDGEVVQIHVNDYWFVYKKEYLLLNKLGSPMCNSNLDILERSYIKDLEDVEIRQLGAVYIPWDTAEYY